MWLVFISEQTVTFALYDVNWLVFITEMKSVYCAVRTGSLNKTVYAVFKRLKYSNLSAYITEQQQNKTAFTNFQRTHQGLSAMRTFPSFSNLISRTDILELPFRVSFPFRFTSLWGVILHFHNSHPLSLSLSRYVCTRVEKNKLPHWQKQSQNFASVWQPEVVLTKLFTSEEILLFC
jgi:uncharacterized membrane protein